MIDRGSGKFSDFERPYTEPPGSFIVGPHVSAQEYETWLARSERYWRQRMTKYRITINETRVVTVTKKEYKILSDTGNKEDDGPRYGYVAYETEEEQHNNVLDLTVDELHLQEILDAVTGVRRDEINLIGDPETE